MASFNREAVPNENVKWLTVAEGATFRTGPLTQPGVEVQMVAEEDMRVRYDRRLVETDDGFLHFFTPYGWLSRRKGQTGKNSFIR